MYASGAVIWRALQKLSTPRRACWATAVPMEPIEAPITAAGMWSNEFCPQGRDAQWIAFLRPPGIERLYSGRDEQHRVSRGDRLLQRSRLGREVRVVILAVQRQIPDRDLGELEVIGRDADQPLREDAVDRGGRRGTEGPRALRDT